MSLHSFLCPQPMSLLLGASWWSNVEDPRIKPESLPYASAKIRRINLPPEINISISTDPNPATDGLLTEWMTKEGELVDPEWPIDNDTLVLAGRTTGKSNYVPAGESSAKDKRPTVRPLVTIVAPGAGPKESRLIGTFPGKAMHIISKPSKGKLTESSKSALPFPIPPPCTFEQPLTSSSSQPVSSTATSSRSTTASNRRRPQHASLAYRVTTARSRRWTGAP